MRIFLGILLVIISYFIGNISPATLLARAEGIDIRKEGSGNAGTTNVLRVLGAKKAVVTLLVDVTKGFIATKLGLILGMFIANHFPTDKGTDVLLFSSILSAWCGLSAFIGHVWPVLFKFKGGKGVATALGVLLATDWVTALICLMIFALVVSATRMVSLGSICAAVFFPFIFLLRLFYGMGNADMDANLNSSFSILISTFFGPRMIPLIIMVVILIFKHRENIGRIRRGEENKLSFKNKEIKNKETNNKETNTES